MQNGKVLTINVSDFQHNTATNMTAETYDPATGTWSAVASLPILLTDPLSCYSREMRASNPTLHRSAGATVFHAFDM